MALPYNQRRVLVIAGSDSSGGAGLEADQKVIAAHGAYAMTATTALTAQNTKGVHGIHVTPPEFVAKQIDACVTDVDIDVVKTGMLACKETVEVVAMLLESHIINVVDPVMVSTSGAHLLPEDAIKAMATDLLPQTFLLTPNISEAVLLVSQKGMQPMRIESLTAMRGLVFQLRRLGPRYILLKGGHLPFSRTTFEAADHSTPDSDKVIFNMLYDCATDKYTDFVSPFSPSPHTHGTGCSLASAIASNLTLEDISLPEAVSNAIDYVSAGIHAAQPLGSGAGPIAHFHSLHPLPFSPGGFVTYLLRHPSVRDAWHRFTHHPFVEALGNGTLPRQSYRYYLAQDYLYLRHFARAHSLAGYKASTLSQAAASAEIVLHIARETALHVKECEGMGLSLREMEGTTEDAACVAYSRFILDTGGQQDWFALQVALLPCLLGYGMVAARLAGGAGRGDEGGRLIRRLARAAKGMWGEDLAADEEEEAQLAGNPYRTWIENYVAEDYTAAVVKGCALVEEWAVRQSAYRIEELVGIFLTATNMETGFWDMGLRAGQR